MPTQPQPWDKKAFAQRVKSARRAKYRSRETFARETGISESAIESYEKGARAPRADTLKLLCEQLDVSPAWLLGIQSG